MTVVCVSWRDNDWSSEGCARVPGYDAAGYTITHCKCSSLALAYATVYQWPSLARPDQPMNATAAVELQTQAESSVSDNNTPFMETDEIVLLVLFVAVAIITGVVLLLRMAYNRRKQILVSTTKQELIAWNMERGNDIDKVPSAHRRRLNVWSLPSTGLGLHQSARATIRAENGPRRPR